MKFFLVLTGVILSVGFSIFYFLQVGLYIQSYENQHQVTSPQMISIHTIPPKLLQAKLIGIYPNDVEVKHKGDLITTQWYENATAFNFTIDFERKAQQLLEITSESILLE